MDARPWWQDCVIYQVYPRSFQDSNGDGIGDLRGVIARADYFAWLGIDAVWFSPFFTSPQADFGYDISDYIDIDPCFGDLDAFDDLVAALHARHIRVILDFVPNHSSNRHPWFLESRSSRRNSKRDWYIWRDPSAGGAPPNNWLSLAGGISWEYDTTTRQFYCHSFLKEQPDLNWRNPAVREAMHDVLRFWLDRGADGFRIDAIGCLGKDAQFRDDPLNPDYKPGDAPFMQHRLVYSANGPQVMDFVAEMRAVVDAHSGEHVLIGETYLKPKELAVYYGTNLNGLQLPTNFNLLWTPWKPGAITETVAAYEAALPRGAWPDWVLGNHDQSRIASRLGQAQARIAMMLLLTLRGTPTIYYGDELGLKDVAITPDQLRDPFGVNMPGIGQGRDPERCPMPWDETPKGGFTTGDPWLPIGRNGPGSSVEAQRRDKKSVLSLTHQLLALRRREPALSRGTWSTVAIEGDALAYRRALGERRFTILLNLDDEPKPISLPDPPGALVLSTHGDRRTIRQRLELAPNEGLIVEA